MGVCGQNVFHSKFAHHDEASKIGERNGGFVAVADTQLVGDIESLSRNPFDPELSTGADSENGV